MSIPTRPSDNALTRKLIHQLNSRLPELTPGSVYSLGAIVGSDYWEHEPESHNTLGKCLKALVSTGRVPFVHLGLMSNRSDKYRYTA